MKHFSFIVGISIGILMGVLLAAPIALQNRNKLQAAQEVIGQVEQDEPDYFYDVLMEGDAWYNYSK